MYMSHELHESRTIEVKNRYVYESPTICVTNYRGHERRCTGTDGRLEGRDGGNRLVNAA